MTIARCFPLFTLPAAVRLSVWIACLLPCLLRAQTDTTNSLQEVVVRGFPLLEYAVGTKHIQLDSAALRQATAQSLAQVLMEQTGIYLKQYGAGGLASISFRGTGANHTSLSWNGLPINSFTLGQTDFSGVLSASAAQMVILPGAGSSLYGTGSVGGSIQLYDVLPDSLAAPYFIQMAQGSFGTWSGQARVQMRRRKWAFQQNFFVQTAKNDFPFLNTARFERAIERQQNAQNTFLGTQTALYFTPNARHLYSLQAWGQARQSQIPPTMGANSQTHLFTQAKEKNLRLLASWKHALPKTTGEIEAKVGYLQDFYLYNLTDSTQTQTWVASGQYAQKVRHNLNFRVGSTHTFITAFVRNYNETKREARHELTAGVHWRPFERLTLALNLRQMWVGTQNVPFTPSLGIDYKVGKVWKLKGFAGRTYRVPTLNERFWNVGGNPNIRPENGISTEAGIAFMPKWNAFQLQIEATPYYLWVRDWILWTPIDNIWTPQNIQTVIAKGIEGQASLRYTHKHVQLTQGLAYNFNQSQTKSKQLPYTPFHRASLWAQLTYRGWLLYQNLAYTSARYTTMDNIDFLPTFYTWNMSAGKVFTLPTPSKPYLKHKITLQIRLNNVLNTDYQNYENRAMPRRNFLLSLSFE